MDISKIDKNFLIIKPDDEGYCYMDILSEPFALEGLAWRHENKKPYYRLPEWMTQNEINEGALQLSNCTSGACIRFRSDSSMITLKAKLAHGNDMNHMPRNGSNGFDSYCKCGEGELTYCMTVSIVRDMQEVKAVCGRNPDHKLCEWVINLPLYGGVTEIQLGFEENSTLLPPLPHAVNAPVLFYGSSITQGGCASRPGNMYSSMLCRKVDAEQINLGFSGSGKGEVAVAKAIADLKLSAFVYDYDHNAPTLQHLKDTHEQFFKIIREKQPDLPVIMLSKCDFYEINGDAERREVIRQTYENAIKAGDKNVYFIDGETLFEGDEMRDACTVDRCHPNDLGFFRMYKNILPVLKQALKQA